MLWVRGQVKFDPPVSWDCKYVSDADSGAKSVQMLPTLGYLETQHYYQGQQEVETFCRPAWNRYCEAIYHRANRNPLFRRPLRPLKVSLVSIGAYLGAMGAVGAN